MLQVLCPRCKEGFRVPDKFAGKAVRCPACSRPVRVPEPKDPAADDPARQLDFGSLEAIEGEGQGLERKRRFFEKKMSLKEARKASGEPEEIAAAKKKDPNLRICPTCHARVHAADRYLEVICPECGKPIEGEQTATPVAARYADSLVGRMHAPVTFYTGFLSAILYPFPAMMWILLGIGVALAAIVLPVGIVLGFAAGTALNPLSQGEDMGWVGWFLTIMFAVEAAYFGAVNYHILIDSIRTTAAGNEQPPALTFNPTQLGIACMGYLAIGLYYCAILAGLLALSHGGSLVLPSTADELHRLRTPANLAILAIVTFMVPMNLIGLASSRWIDGLNPARVVRSILRCIGHYTFLFMIVVIFLGAYTGIMMGVMEWAATAIVAAMRDGVQKGLLTLIWGLLAWAAVIGAGFFFTYSLGRILGLFARTYREDLDFDI